MTFSSQRFRITRPAFSRLPGAAFSVVLRRPSRWFLYAFYVVTFAVPADAAPLTLNDPRVRGRDNFGSSVALDGNRVLVGARGSGMAGSDVGQAHLFDMSGNLLQTFDDPTPASLLERGDRFGVSVAISGDNVLIGADRDATNGTDVGQANLFDVTTGNLLQTFNDPTPTNVSGGGDRFGASVAIDGNSVLVGAAADDTLGENVGQAHLFDALSGNLLWTFNDPTVTEFDHFGVSVALDGNNVLIGAFLDSTLGSQSGQAHLFDGDPLSPTFGNLLWTFNNPTVTGNGNFGGSVAIEGNNVVIGASRDDTLGGNVGQAHLFDLSGNLLRTFNDPTPNGNDRFGSSVALDGNNVLVGAFADDTLGNSVGQAHLFDALSGNLLRTFNDPTPTDSDYFGSRVAIEGGNVLIGALGDDTVEPDVGQAHLFTFLGPENGDYNYDGDVGGPDYTVWANTFGETGPGLAADGNDDEVIGPQDYTLWANNFGMGVGNGPQAVPEPSAFLLMAFGVVALVIAGRVGRRGE